MVNSTMKGKINNSKNSATISITLDSASNIILTGNSYISSLNNADSTGSNIVKGSYSFEDYNGNAYTATGSESSEATTTSPSTTSAPTTPSLTTTPVSSSGNDNNSTYDHWIRVNSNNYISYSILLCLINILLLN